ncbi:MAG: hypothetical protein ACK6DS_16525, partial [Planctomycetota bacterium]
MGTVFKKWITRLLPAGAEVSIRRRRATPKELKRNPGQATVVETVATWRGRNGKERTALVVVAEDGSNRIKVETKVFYAKYRDGHGQVQVVATGCRDKEVAERKLKQLESVAEKVRIGALTQSDLETSGHNRTPLPIHVADYISYLKRNGRHPDRIKTTEKRLLEIFEGCHFERLQDLKPDPVCVWLDEESGKNRSPSVLNGYVEAVVAFGYWLAGKRINGRRSNTLGEKRLLQNPFAGIGRFDDKSDRRRQRRALSELELRKLLYVARWRPLAEFGRLSKPGEAPDKNPGKATKA